MRFIDFVDKSYQEIIVKNQDPNTAYSLFRDGEENALTFILFTIRKFWKFVFVPVVFFKYALTLFGLRHRPQASLEELRKIHQMQQEIEEQKKAQKLKKLGMQNKK